MKTCILEVINSTGLQTAVAVISILIVVYHRWSDRRADKWELLMTIDECYVKPMDEKIENAKFILRNNSSITMKIFKELQNGFREVTMNLDMDHLFQLMGRSFKAFRKKEQRHEAYQQLLYISNVQKDLESFVSINPSETKLNDKKMRELFNIRIDYIEKNNKELKEFLRKSDKKVLYSYESSK